IELEEFGVSARVALELAPKAALERREQPSWNRIGHPVGAALLDCAHLLCCREAESPNDLVRVSVRLCGVRPFTEASVADVTDVMSICACDLVGSGAGDRRVPGVAHGSTSRNRHRDAPVC